MSDRSPGAGGDPTSHTEGPSEPAPGVHVDPGDMGGTVALHSHPAQPPRFSGGEGEARAGNAARFTPRGKFLEASAGTETPGLSSGSLLRPGAAFSGVGERNVRNQPAVAVTPFRRGRRVDLLSREGACSLVRSVDRPCGLGVGGGDSRSKETPAQTMARTQQTPPRSRCDGFGAGASSSQWFLPPSLEDGFALPGRVAGGRLGRSQRCVPSRRAEGGHVTVPSRKAHRELRGGGRAQTEGGPCLAPLH